jgi:hypothetical protein
MEEYSSYSFPRYFWYRSGRPLAIEERMQIRTIHYGSPLFWIPVTASWVAVKIIQPLVQISGEIADWSPNRRKAKAEAVKAELETIEKLADIEYKQIQNRRQELLLEQEQYRTEMTKMALEELKKQRELGQKNTLRQLQRRLTENPYQLEDISIEIEEGENSK